MKKIIFTLLIILISISFVRAETGISFHPYYKDDLKIRQIREFIQIKGDRVETEYVIEIIVRGLDYNGDEPKLEFYFTKGEDKFFNPEIIDYIACQADEGKEAYTGHSYKHIDLEGCNNLLDVNLSWPYNKWHYLFTINKEKIRIDKPFSTLYFQIRLIYPNFIIRRSVDQKFFWHEISIYPEVSTIERFLTTEEDTLILSLSGYKIEIYDFDEEKFILSSRNLTETWVFYKNERDANNRRITNMVFAGIIAFLIYLILDPVFKRDIMNENIIRDYPQYISSKALFQEIFNQNL